MSVIRIKKMPIIDNSKTGLFLGIVLCLVMVACSNGVNDSGGNPNQKMLIPPPTQLRWSPDGEWIVYTQLQSIQMINTNTKEIKMLTGTGIYNHPVWSPDGTKIAYDYAPEELTGDIWIKTVQPSIGVSKKLTSATQSDLCPEWSPDGNTIAFQSHRTGNWDLWLISLDGSGEPIQLTNDPGSDQIPLWSPDGSKIAFKSNRTKDYEIWVISVDDMKLRQITNVKGEETNYRWSPDGSKIAYRAQRDKEYNIWVTDANGSGIETQISLRGNAGTFDWEPNGRHILYQAGDYVYCRNSDGTGKIITVAKASEPLWSPDGEKIAFVRLDKKSNEFVIEIVKTPEVLK